MAELVEKLNQTWGKPGHIEFRQNPNQPAYATLQLNKGNSKEQRICTDF